MSSLVKAVIAAGAALAVGFLAGFLVGGLGRADAEAAAARAKRVGAEAEENAKRESEECRAQVAVAKSSRNLLQSKESMLRALVELHANNFGLTSQHLAQARSWLRSAQKGLKKADAERVRVLYDRVGDAQTLAMRLDPQARARIDQILAEIQRLPGAR
jgi:hypothetical protein